MAALLLLREWLTWLVGLTTPVVGMLPPPPLLTSVGALPLEPLLLMLPLLPAVPLLLLLPLLLLPLLVLWLRSTPLSTKGWFR